MLQSPFFWTSKNCRSWESGPYKNLYSHVALKWAEALTVYFNCKGVRGRFTPQRHNLFILHAPTISSHLLLILSYENLHLECKLIPFSFLVGHPCYYYPVWQNGKHETLQATPSLELHYTQKVFKTVKSSVASEIVVMLLKLDSYCHTQSAELFLDIVFPNTHTPKSIFLYCNV